MTSHGLVTAVFVYLFSIVQHNKNRSTDMFGWTFKSRTVDIAIICVVSFLCKRLRTWPNSQTLSNIVCERFKICSTTFAFCHDSKQRSSNIFCLPQAICFLTYEHIVQEICLCLAIIVLLCVQTFKYCLISKL